MNLFIDDTPALNIFELRAKCRRLKNKHNTFDLKIIYYGDKHSFLLVEGVPLR